MWTKNFQMFKLDLEKGEEPEIKLLTSVGSEKKLENSRKTSTSALLIMPKSLTVWITTNCGNFLKRWEYQITLLAFWEICMQVKKQIRTGYGTTDCFKMWKGVHQGCILSPCLFNLYAEYIIQNAGLDEAQAGIKTSRRNTNNLRYADDTTLMAESKELKSLLMKVKGKLKTWLKTQHSENKDHGIQSHHFMANRCRNSGSSERLYFPGSKITADGDCSHEIKRCLLLGRKAMTNLDSILKSRDIALLTKLRIAKAMVFAVAMYGCESLTIKKTEHGKLIFLNCGAGKDSLESLGLQGDQTSQS